MSYDSWKQTEPEPVDTRAPLRSRLTRLACRCGADMTYATAIGHLSMETICHACAASEGKEYLRRRAEGR